MKTKRVTLVIGAGGVGRVVVHKCARNAATFGTIVLASRSIGRCEVIKSELPEADIEIATLDADKTEEIAALIRRVHADIVINVALPYQDLSIMDACIATQTPYLDTANYEHPMQQSLSTDSSGSVTVHLKRRVLWDCLGVVLTQG